MLLFADIIFLLFPPVKDVRKTCAKCAKYMYIRFCTTGKFLPSYKKTAPDPCCNAGSEAVIIIIIAVPLKLTQRPL